MRSKNMLIDIHLGKDIIRKLEDLEQGGTKLNRHRRQVVGVAMRASTVAALMLLNASRLLSHRY